MELEPTSVETQRQQLIIQLKDFGFDESLILKAVVLTLDKQKAAELIVRYLENGIDADVSDILPPPAPQPKQQLNIESLAFKYKMLFVVNGSLKMGKGKICAQVGHAALGAYLDMEELAIHDKNAKQTLYNWQTFGCAKIVVRADNLHQMLEVKKKAEAAGINTHLIEDAGHTQVKEGSKTVLALGPALCDHLDPITRHFKLL